MRVDFFHWAVTTVALLLTAVLLPGLRIRGLLAAAFCAAVLGLVNAAFWDSDLFTTIPLSLTTRSVSLVLANGAIFWVLAKLLPGVEVDGFLPAVAAPLLFSFIGAAAAHYGPRLASSEPASSALSAIEGMARDVRDAASGARAKGAATPTRGR